MRLLWSFLAQVFLSSLSLIPLVLSQQIKVPITATEGSSVTVTVFNDIGLQEYALYIVQDRSVEAFSVFTTITPDASVRAQTVVFPAPTPGEFRIVMEDPSTTISAIPSGIGSSEEFEVVSNPDGGSRTSQTSPSSNPQTGPPGQVSATATMTTIIHGDAGSVTFTVTASPSPSSFDGTNSRSKSAVSIPGLVGGLLGGLITTIILIGLFLWRRQHGRSIKPPSIEPYDYRPNQRRYVSRYLFPKADSRSESENNPSQKRPDYLQSDEDDTPISAQPDVESGLEHGTAFTQGNGSEKDGVPRRVSRVLHHTDSGWRGGGNNADDVVSSFSEFPPSYTSS